MSEGVRGVDGEYVELLEMYCLLRLRLLDVRHKWGNVTRVALSDHGKYAGVCVCIDHCVTVQCHVTTDSALFQCSLSVVCVYVLAYYSKCSVQEQVMCSAHFSFTFFSCLCRFCR